MKDIEPYSLNNLFDHFARTVWHSSRSGYKPSMVLKTVINTISAQNYAKENNLSINSIFIKSIAEASLEFPRLNYYSFWGKPVWGGKDVRISVVFEAGDEGAINFVNISDAAKKDLKTIQEEIKSLSVVSHQSKTPKTLKTVFMNRFPWLSYYIMRYTGVLEKDYKKDFSPVIFSNMNVPEIVEVISGGIGFVSMIISPGSITDGKCIFNLAFNHDVANGRPFGKYLARVKEIIETYRI